MEKLVEIQKVFKSFGVVKAVDGVTLDIEKGEFFSLLGPSGCGKTTLLRLIAGFEKPTSGELLIDNKRMQGVEPNLRPTNMVFQNYAIFPIECGRKCSLWSAKKNISKSEKLSSIDNVLALVGLSGLN